MNETHNPHSLSNPFKKEPRKVSLFADDPNNKETDPTIPSQAEGVATKAKLDQALEEKEQHDRLYKQLQTLAQEVGKDEQWIQDTFEIRGDTIYVEGNLKLRRCKSLTTLPDNLSVSGNLDLFLCTSLTEKSLTPELIQKGNIILPNLPNITEILSRVSHVSGNLDLSYCKSLTTLPDNLSVSGNLDLSHCTSLTTLPDNLSVSGNLNLHYCTSLTTLPDNLYVSGDLHLRVCTEAVQEQGRRLKVEGKIQGNLIV